MTAPIELTTPTLTTLFHESLEYRKRFQKNVIYTNLYDLNGSFLGQLYNKSGRMQYDPNTDNSPVAEYH